MLRWSEHRKARSVFIPGNCKIFLLVYSELAIIMNYNVNLLDMSHVVHYPVKKLPRKGKRAYYCKRLLPTFDDFFGAVGSAQHMYCRTCSAYML
jgi:hypothetical protein